MPRWLMQIFSYKSVTYATILQFLRARMSEWVQRTLNFFFFSSNLKHDATVFLSNFIDLSFSVWGFSLSLLYVVNDDDLSRYYYFCCIRRQNDWDTKNDFWHLICVCVCECECTQITSEKKTKKRRRRKVDGFVMNDGILGCNFW